MSIYNISKELNVKYNTNKEHGVLLRIIVFGNMKIQFLAI